MGFKIDSILGEVVKKGELKVFDSGFQIQQVVIKTYDDYPEFMPLDFKKDDVNKLKHIKVGDHVEAACFAGGREWIPGGEQEAKYFAGYSGTFIKKADAVKDAPNDLPDASNIIVKPIGDDDGLPF